MNNDDSTEGVTIEIFKGEGEKLSSENLTLENWKSPAKKKAFDKSNQEVVVDCGWGRLIFAHTFLDADALLETLRGEEANERDIAIYVHDPHVLLALGPQEVFLDPSHTYRYWLNNLEKENSPPGVKIRRVQSLNDEKETNRIYETRNMVKCREGFIYEQRQSSEVVFLIAENELDNRVVGTVMGLDHVSLFSDPEQGCSLWCLAVDPECPLPGVGQALVQGLMEHFKDLGRRYLDLSVMHDNKEAIALYEKIGFQRVPVFCVKRRNPVNEPLFVAEQPDSQLNPYGKIIVREAKRRGIFVVIEDAEANLFTLTFGGRSIRCIESLSDLTSAVVFSICQSKRLTHSVLSEAGFNVPSQLIVTSDSDASSFLKEHSRVVVKPENGEQGKGVTVDVRTQGALFDAIDRAKQYCDEVVLEAFVEGDDLRLVVIDYKVVAAAIRKPPTIIGTGKHTCRQLIEKLSRKRLAATGGESQVPLDKMTEKCLFDAGVQFDSVLPHGTTVKVRKTANLHTGGTLLDVTDALNPMLRETAESAARALSVPVVGLDFLVPSVEGETYTIIEANERPGLANHEPQPTAERFIDLLFPETAETV